MDFDHLYDQNCAGCHGAEGVGGPATPIGDELYLQWADMDVVRRVIAEGIPDTPMAAFSERSGGSLNDEQVDALVAGLQAKRKKKAKSRRLLPYGGTEGDAIQGATVYKTYCADCHGAQGRGGDKAGAIVNDSYLALVSPQGLRTAIVVGRPDFDMPDYRHYVRGQPMTDEEVQNLVAWLISQRAPFPGRLPHDSKANTPGPDATEN
jgi:mono/diheme cytochrome c family protein